MQKLAVLIDADNTSYKHIEWILKEIEHYGIPTIKRIYGDWSAENLKSWSQTLLKFNIKPIQQFSYVSNKNMTDTRLIIDTMDLLYQEQLDGFCIISSDCDYIPLVSRLRENGLKVYGFGNREKVNPIILDVYTKFIYIQEELKLTNLENVSNSDTLLITNNLIKTSTLKSKKVLLQELKNIITKNGLGESWINFSTIGMYLKSKDYGCESLTELFEQLEGFEIKAEGSQKFLREKSKSEKILQITPREKALRNAILNCNIEHNLISFGVLGKYINYKQFGFGSLLKFIQSINNVKLKKLNTQYYIEVTPNLLGQHKNKIDNIKSIIYSAIKQVPKESNNWCYLGYLSKYIDYKKLGFSKLKKLFMSLDYIEIKDEGRKTFIRIK